MFERIQTIWRVMVAMCAFYWLLVVVWAFATSDLPKVILALAGR